MQKILLFLKKRPHLLILGLILLIALFFRVYKVIDRFEYAHDGDLYSWIVKDIITDGHLRLIGQLTSAPGIFIGPLYYYLIIPFFFLSNMYPIGAIIPITIIGVLTVASYYIVFSKLFNIKIGLIAAFLYATLLSLVQLDRKVVPSTPTNIWAIWYFYTIVSIARGNYSVLPILGVLIGLIWHIHIALIPALIAIPAALIISKKLPTKKQTFYFMLALFISLLPLIVFETRHDFQQTKSLISNFFIKSDGATGLYKIQVVLEMIVNNINSLFFMPQSFPEIKNIFVGLLILLSLIILPRNKALLLRNDTSLVLLRNKASLLLRNKLLSSKELVPLFIWLIGVAAFYSLSSSPISEYYFSNIEVIFLMFAVLLFYCLYASSTTGKLLTLLILGTILTKNAHFLISQDYYHKGYMEKKKIVEYIVQDAKNNNYPCIGITYITSPGENVGFRYLFYLNNLHITRPSLEVPVYNIVIPDELSLKEVKIKYGHIGLIPPKNNFSASDLNKTCQGENTNLTDSMFGFVK